MLKLNLIAAIDKNNAIGYLNNLLFKNKQDLEHFKNTTTGGIVVMGRKTLESIGKPLPNRINIVLTTDENYELPEKVIRASSIGDVLVKVSNIHSALYKDSKDDCRVYFIGGGQIYEQTMDLCDSLIITVFDEEATHSDTFLPTIDESVFQLQQTKYLNPSIKIKYYDRRTVR